MNDIVIRLRNEDNSIVDDLLNEAADEIKRLRMVLGDIRSSLWLDSGIYPSRSARYIKKVDEAIGEYKGEEK